MTSPSSPTPVESALARIEEKVRQRRMSGEYPPGLESQLDRHFREFQANVHRSVSTEPLDTALVSLRDWPGFSTARIKYTTAVPGGSLVHRIMGKLARRQTEAMMSQSQEHADRVSTVLAELVQLSRLAAAQADNMPLALRESLSAMHDRLAELDELAVRVRALETRLDSVSPPKG